MNIFNSRKSAMMWLTGDGLGSCCLNVQFNVLVSEYYFSKKKKKTKTKLTITILNVSALNHNEVFSAFNTSLCSHSTLHLGTNRKTLSIKYSHSSYFLGILAWFPALIMITEILRNWSGWSSVQEWVKLLNCRVRTRTRARTKRSILTVLTVTHTYAAVGFLRNFLNQIVYIWFRSHWYVLGYFVLHGNSKVMLCHV